MTKLFFATDVHGSNVCWNKFINAGKFYKADVLILGGDLTGKAIVPIVDLGSQIYKVNFLEQKLTLQSEEDVQEMFKRIKSRGYYPYLTNPDEMQELNVSPEKINKLFVSQVLKTAQEWLEYADKKLEGTGMRCFVSPGNDDMFELDDIIRSSKHIQLAEGQVIALNDQHEMISSGWSNVTPWETFREEGEDKLLERYAAMIAGVRDIRNSVFNIHVPPYGSNLDLAPETTVDLRPKYAGNSLVPVGSHAVRQIIDQYQPLLGLFGHIHESKGAIRMGRTLCVNPGSMYEQGTLCGALIELRKDKIKNYVLTNG